MSQRIEYLDAMRGFTMFLVVLAHTIPLSFLNSLSYEPLSFNAILTEFRMPLFFFVSGFVFYKLGRKWDWSTIWSFIKKKVPVQIVTPALFMLAYFLLCDINLYEGLTDMNKRGYWFTFTLFEFFLAYIVSSVILDLFKLKEGKLRDAVMLGISFLIFCSAFNSVYKYFGLSSDFRGLIGLEQFARYPFFVFGVLTHKYFEQFEKQLEKGIIVYVSLALFVVLNILIAKHPVENAIISVFFSLIFGTSGIIVIFYAFRKCRSLLSKDKTVGRVFQYVGRHTLDIYLIHYFFLLLFYKVLDWLAPIIESMEVPTGRFIVGVLDFAGAFLIVPCCLLVSRVIRLIPFVDHWMFGAKKTA